MGKIYSANVGDRFIIEIGAIADVQGLGADNDNIDTLYKVKGFNSLVFDDNGIKKLAKAKDLKDEVEEAYKKGLNDAWEAARKICAGRFAGKIDTGHILNFTATEALDKIKAYEEEKSKISVGDEIDIDDIRAVVTCVDEENDRVFVLYVDGYIDEIEEIDENVKPAKTGRHFDEVESLLKVLKGGEDSEQVSF